jgi:hypothetical protein
MLTILQCQAYAAEYKLLGVDPGISIRHANMLMSISHSWIVMAGQLERLADVMEEEGK